MFPSRLISDDLIVAMAVLSKHALACVGGWFILDFCITGVSVMTIFLGPITFFFADSGVPLGGIGGDEPVHRLVWCLRLHFLHLRMYTWKYTE